MFGFVEECIRLRLNLSMSEALRKSSPQLQYVPLCLLFLVLFRFFDVRSLVSLSFSPKVNFILLILLRRLIPPSPRGKVNYIDISN